MFKQLTMMILMVLSSDAAAWWLLKAQGLATKWIAPSAYTAATIGALIIAVVVTSFMTRWRQLTQPTERVATAPDDNPWAAQALLFGRSDRLALKADILTAYQAGALSESDLPIKLTKSAPEVLPDRLSRLLHQADGQPAKKATKRMMAQGTHSAKKMLSHASRGALVIGIIVMLIGLCIASPLGETTKPVVSAASWLTSICLAILSYRTIMRMVWAGSKLVGHAVVALFITAVMLAAALQVQWPDLMPFWFMGMVGVIGGSVWPLCWSVKKPHQQMMQRWAGYRHTIKNEASSDELQPIAIALHLK